MTFQIYDTMTRSQVRLSPVKPGEVSLYACGPTVYDDAHVGHARAAVAFDVLVRRLAALGHRIVYVRNFTDVDDKIINRAREQGRDWRELAESCIRSFNEDLDALNCRRPDHSPRATEYVEQMLEDVQAIVAKGLAYVSGGDVFFDVAALAAYGRLSGRQAQDQEAGARVAVDERKKNPADFALWKAAKPGEPSWPSPWGDGRPGWHTECSTMSARLLGPIFDIHGGGQDLIFPHHENELAQAAALDRPMARIWAHNGFVNVNNEKMSKSLGNFFAVKDILKVWPAEVLRYFLVSKHYRSPIEFSEEGLRESGKALERVYRALAAAEEFLGGPDDGRVDVSSDAESVQRLVLFGQAMDDDLNASQALGHVFDLVHLLNKNLDAGARTAAAAARRTLVAMGEQLGLWRRRPADFFDSLKAGSGPSREDIERLVAARNEARANKDWPEADRLRQELTGLGVALEDKAGQTVWRRV
ncbi:MAG: cysteine--tRNA ligase [Deltaproteobacteria bacterium]|jgi:cysteinyl-tRNA synthetase|nr:cysteine--tRNA ligase [Deltaproteobacteria bacterium]